MNRLLPPGVFTNDAPQDYGTDGKLFSVVSTRGQAGGINYTLQVAQDRSSDERFMKNFAALLAIILALGIVAAAAIAFTVTKRSLRPLAEMTRSLKRVGPKHLHERTPVTSWPRELQPLAVAFDDMLDRLEDSFTRLSQFSADLAHELRTPIANIRGEGEVALTRARTPDEYREVIESSVGECERLSAIVDNLLFLARAEAAERPLAAERVRWQKRDRKNRGLLRTNRRRPAGHYFLRRRRQRPRRSDAFWPGREQSRGKRAALHSRRRKDSDFRRCPARAHRGFRERYRLRNCAGAFAASVRSFLSRRPSTQFGRRGPGSRPGEIDKRTSRRIGGDRERSQPGNDGDAFVSKERLKKGLP